MKKFSTKEINGLLYVSHNSILSDGRVSVAIYPKGGAVPVHQKCYPLSLDKAIAQGWKDYDKVRAQIMAKKAKL